MKYSIEQVPGFLLYDGISWCRKHNRAQVRFFRTVDNVREDIIVTPAAILAEIIRRQSEITPITRCVSCGAETDGRCQFTASEPLCEPCYWAVILSLHGGQPVAPVKGKVLMMPSVQKGQAQIESHEETPEEVAARLGVSLDVLQASGYFD